MSILLLVLILFGLVILLQTIKIVPQKQVKIIERLGKYHFTAEAGLNTIVPFLDSVRETIDVREQITKIEPQPVITRDNVTMSIEVPSYDDVAAVLGQLRTFESLGTIVMSNVTANEDETGGTYLSFAVTCSYAAAEEKAAAAAAQKATTAAAKTETAAD